MRSRSVAFGRVRRAALLLGVGWLVTSGCATGGEVDDPGGCPVGAEGCACTEGGACDLGLACLSDFCVDFGGAGGAGGATAVASQVSGAASQSAASGSSGASSSSGGSTTAASSSSASSSSAAASSSSSSGGGACAHSPCVEGAALPSGCGSCATTVCVVYQQSDCCTLTWDDFCVLVAEVYCPECF